MATTMTISLPDEMRSFIEQQIKTGSFSSASEFIRQLVREEQRRAQKDQLEQRLMEGLESGKPVRADDAYWQQLRKRVERRTGRRLTSDGTRK